jgi:hypothetical protein
MVPQWAEEVVILELSDSRGPSKVVFYGAHE